MSYHHQITFKCDSCDTHYMIDEDHMELPPGWIAAQIVMADTDGCVPDSDRELFCHFCNLVCMADFISANKIKQKLYSPGNNSFNNKDGTGEEPEGLQS